MHLSMTGIEGIENAEALSDVFGYWPSFHDAEVVRIALDRSGPQGPTLDAAIHVFHMTSDVDASGHFVLTHHTLVVLRFTKIVLRDLHGFNSQNSLSGLNIVAIDPTQNEGRRYGVGWDANWGIEADFDCQSITVVSVEPFSPAV
jgi:hypothetical protein